MTVTNYTGNAGLGSGSNPQIPVIANEDFDSVNRTGQQLMQQNMMQNKALFDQKIKDRDTLLAEIDSGNIRVGDILEPDTAYVKEGLDGLDKAWEERMKKGVNDIDAQRKYKKALRDAQDRVTQAQGRKVFYDQESQALSKETLPRKQQARKQNLDSVVGGGFWKDIMPYQQTLDNDFDVIKAYPKLQKTTVTDPKRPLYKGERSFVDYDQVKAESGKDFLENIENREYQIGLLKGYQDMPAQKANEELKAIQNRLNEYNSKRGLAPGQQGFAAPIKIATNPDGTPVLTPDGKMIIDESVPDFAAKWALAAQPQYVQEDFKVDPGALNIAELDERTRHNKAMEGLDRSRLSLAFKEFDLKSNAAGATQQMAESAKQYAEGLIGKLNGMRDASGLISRQNLSKLTNDELKYLGIGKTEENKFTLTPLKIDDNTKILLEDDGTIKVFRGGTSKSLGTQSGSSIDIKTIATNKLGDEMIQTTGKEGYNFNNLIELYKPTGTAQESKQVELSQDPNDWKAEGKNWRYKDGKLYNASGKVVKE